MFPLLAAALLFQVATAQFATGADPEAVADDAVRSWLEQEQPTLQSVSNLTTAEVCQLLPDLVQNPPPEPNTKVNFDDRLELETGDADVRRFTYSAVRPNDQLEVVQVTLERHEEGWSATQVGYRLPANRQGRQWLQNPLVGWIFTAFSLYVLFLLMTPSFLRQWLSIGLKAIREHRGLVLFTMVLLYSVMVLGTLTGRQLPDECGDAVLTIVTSTLDSIGLTDALGSGSVIRTASFIFYQNFVVVTLSVTFSLALLFGIPAYLFSMMSYFVQPIAWTILGAFSGPQVIPFLTLLLLELTAYFLIVAGGGMFLSTLLKKGFGSLSEGFTKLALMLPIAMILLLIGAWYESVLVLMF
ncbi:MAG: hypothetical protein JSV66_09425 [Trueperaceae bacterium]|nr:MAG: hypothetical protein JSV66_09425 [Trueperaceae bacterium]